MVLDDSIEASSYSGIKRSKIAPHCTVRSGEPAGSKGESSVGISNQYIC